MAGIFEIITGGAVNNDGFIGPPAPPSNNSLADKIVNAIPGNQIAEGLVGLIEGLINNGPDPKEFFKQIDINEACGKAYYIWASEFAPNMVATGNVWDRNLFGNKYAFNDGVNTNFPGVRCAELIGKLDANFRLKPEFANGYNTGNNGQGNSGNTMGSDKPFFSEGPGVLVVIAIGAIAVIFGPKIIKALRGN